MMPRGWPSSGAPVGRSRSKTWWQRSAGPGRSRQRRTLRTPTAGGARRRPRGRARRRCLSSARSRSRLLGPVDGVWRHDGVWIGSVGPRHCRGRHRARLPGDHARRDRGGAHPACRAVPVLPRRHRTSDATGPRADRGRHRAESPARLVDMLHRNVAETLKTTVSDVVTTVLDEARVRAASIVEEVAPAIERFAHILDQTGELVAPISSVPSRPPACPNPMADRRRPKDDRRTGHPVPGSPILPPADGWLTTETAASEIGGVTPRWVRLQIEFDAAGARPADR